jgi:hypothetical protein
MKIAEFLLAGGLACLALAAGLCQFVMIGLIGLVLFVVALGLLLSAGALARSAEPISVWQKSAGLILYLAGVVLLLVVAGYASSLAFDWGISLTMSSVAPTILDWGLAGLSSLAPAVLIAVGLRYRTNCSWRRCAVWGMAVLCVCPAAVLIFWSLFPMLPISA